MKKFILLMLMAICLFTTATPVFAGHGYINARVCNFGGGSDYLEANSWYAAPRTFDYIIVRNYHYKKVSGSWSYIDMGVDYDQTMFQRAHAAHWHGPRSLSFKSTGTHGFSHTDSAIIYYKYTSTIDSCV